MENSLTAKRCSVLCMLVCAGLWSIAGIFIKLIPWNPLVIAGFRSLIGSVVVAAYMAAAKVRFRLNRASLLSGILLTLTFLAFVAANKLTTAANAIVLQFTAPIYIVLLSAAVYKQRFRRGDILAVLLVIGGIALCFFDQLSAGTLAGNCVGLLSGVFFGSMFIVTGYTDSESRMSGILLGQLFTAVVGVPMALVFPTPVTVEAVISIVILGIFQLGIPYILYAFALANCPPLVCCLLGAVEPLLNPLWVFIFAGEQPGVFSIAGGLIVIIIVTIWNIWGEKNPLESSLD